MKPKLLLVTEDIIEIQTFSGKLGNLYAIFYQLFLKLKLKLAILVFQRHYDITVLATDQYFPCSATFSRYSEQLEPDKMDAFKSLAWSIFNNLANSIDQADRPLFTFWQNKITSRLMNYYLSYLELLTRLISSDQYSHILILGNSVQEQIAKFLCRQHQRKLINFSLINFNSLTKTFFRYFRQREISKKLNNFKIQSQQPKLSFKLLSQPVLLSVDLYRHLKTLIPVYIKLQHYQLKPLLIADELLIGTYLKNSQAANLNYIFLANFLSIEIIKAKISEWQPVVNLIYQRATKAVTADNSNSLEALILNLSFPEISPLVKDGLVLAKLYLLAGENLFSTIKPKAVIVAADIRLSEVSLSYLAKIYRVPSLTVSPRTIIFSDEPYQYNLTDSIAVTGPDTKNQLIKLKVPSQKIIITGDPRYDYFSYLSIKFSPHTALSKLGIKSTQKKIILLISERPNLYLSKAEKKEYFLLVSRVMADHPDKILVIKPHPTEKKYRILEELNQWGITNAIVSDNQKIELFDLLKLSSVVVMVWSMTGLEAMMLKKPVIIVNPHQKNFDKFIPYLKNKAAIEAKTTSVLSKYLTIYSNSQNPKTKSLIAAGLQFSQHYIKQPDGQAAERIVQALAIKPPSTKTLTPVT